MGCFSSSGSGSFSSPSSPSFFSASFFFFFSASAFFFASASAFFLGSFHSPCFLFHVPTSFCHSVHLPLNHSDGCSSSTRWVSFLSSTHFFMYSLHSASGCHTYW